MGVLGDLELQVMRRLWASPDALSVRQVHESLNTDRALAYTTVMTVLDRLAKKSWVTRAQEGRAWLYRPAVTHAELVSRELLEVIGAAGDVADEALVAFVDGLPPQLQRVLGERVFPARQAS